MSTWLIKKELKAKWTRKWEKKKIFRDLKEKIGYKQWHEFFYYHDYDYDCDHDYDLIHFFRFCESNEL